MNLLILLPGMECQATKKDRHENTIEAVSF